MGAHFCASTIGEQNGDADIVTAAMLSHGVQAQGKHTGIHQQPQQLAPELKY